MPPPQCSICLSSFKDPVCIPCGHIYCTKCIADHINVSDNEELSAACPTCRTSFDTHYPDLTCLPKKYHRFIIPGIRRVYIDTSDFEVLQTKLKHTEKKLKDAESKRDIMMKQCERYMASLGAHREGERQAVRNARELEKELNNVRAEMRITRDQADQRVMALEGINQNLIIQYDDLKLRHNETTANLPDSSHSNVLAKIVKKRTGIRYNYYRPAIKISGPPPEREIGILPPARVKISRARSASPPPNFDHHERQKRPRLSEQMDTSSQPA